MSNTLSPLNNAVLQFVEVLVQELSQTPPAPSNGTSGGFDPSELAQLLSGIQDTTGFNVGSQAGSVSGPTAETTLAVSGGTDAQTLKSFINNNSAQPKIAVTDEGSTIFVLATSTNAQGEDMVETASPADPDGGADWMPMSDFEKQVSYLDTGTNGRGTQVTALSTPADSNIKPGGDYTFNAFYTDPQSQQTMASLTDSSGKNVNIPVNQFSEDFGFLNYQNVVHSSLGPSAASAMQLRGLGGASGDGFSISPQTNPQDLESWLQKGTTPYLASDWNGSTFVVDNVSDKNGQPTVTVQDPESPNGGTQTMSLSTFSENFHYVDRGTAGIGTKFTAAQSSGQVQAGTQYSYKGMSVDAHGQAQVNLMGSDNMPVSLPLSQFASTFGQSALQNLLVSSRTNPGTPFSSETYNTVQNSELFSASSGSMGQVEQGGVGDCYLESSLASLTRQNPNFMKNMIRPSTDGNPNDYDVRFYVPQTDGTNKPVWVTVNNQLPMVSSGTLAGAQGVLDNQSSLEQIGPALIEKAYVQLNQQYGTQSSEGGYQGINGGIGSEALTYLTGQNQQTERTQSLSDSQLLQSLSAANSGQPVVVGTQAGNTLEPGLAENVVQGHAYSVLGTSTSSTGEPLVTLRNPWGVNTDANGNPVKGSDGVFTIPLSEFRKYFNTVTAPGTSNT